MNAGRKTAFRAENQHLAVKFLPFKGPQRYGNTSNIGKDMCEWMETAVLKTGEEVIGCRRLKDENALLQSRKLFTKIELGVKGFRQSKLAFH